MKVTERIVAEATLGDCFELQSSAGQRLLQLARADPHACVAALGARAKRRGRGARATYAVFVALDACLARGGPRLRAAACERALLDPLLHGLNSLRFLKEGARGGGEGRDAAFAGCLALVRAWAECAQHCGEPLGPLVEVYVHMHAQNDVHFPHPRVLAGEQLSLWARETDGGNVQDVSGLRGVVGNTSGSGGGDSDGGGRGGGGSGGGGSGGGGGGSGGGGSVSFSSARAYPRGGARDDQGFTSPMFPHPRPRACAATSLDDVFVAVEVDVVGGDRDDPLASVSLRPPSMDATALPRSLSLPSSPSTPAGPSAPLWPGTPPAEGGTHARWEEEGSNTHARATAHGKSAFRSTIRDARGYAEVLSEVLESEFERRRATSVPGVHASDGACAGAGGGGGADSLIRDLATSCAGAQEVLHHAAIGGGGAADAVAPADVEALFGALEVLDIALTKYQKLVDARLEDHRQQGDGQTTRHADAHDGCEELTCVICMDLAPTVTLRACGHRVMCEDCHARVCLSAAAECPVCRTPIARGVDADAAENTAQMPPHNVWNASGRSPGAHASSRPTARPSGTRGAHARAREPVDLRSPEGPTALASHARECAQFVAHAGTDSRLHSPREGMPLCVLDIDGTLADASWRGDAAEAARAARPGLEEFLRNANLYFDLGVWSQTPSDVVWTKLHALGLLGRTDVRFVCVLGVEAMCEAVPPQAEAHDSTAQTGHAPACTCKPLEVVWAHASLGRSYSRDTSVMVDDNARNFALNASSGIRVGTYHALATEGGRSTDSELFLLQSYLAELATECTGGKQTELAAVDKSRWRLQTKWRLRHQPREARRSV